MLVIQLSFITGQHPLEVASATLDDVTYCESSRSSCVAKLARALVAAGIPDQPWQAVSPNGTVSLRGRSLHGIAKTTISESDRDAGIPGVKYLDQGSRSSGQGTYNYVVFDPKTIEILRKYGIAGLMAGGAAAVQQQQ